MFLLHDPVGQSHTPVVFTSIFRSCHLIDPPEFHFKPQAEHTVCESLLETGYDLLAGYEVLHNMDRILTLPLLWPGIMLMKWDSPDRLRAPCAAIRLHLI